MQITCLSDARVYIVLRVYVGIGIIEQSLR